jgi:integrase
MRTRGSGSIFPRGDAGTLWIKYHRNGRPYRESAHTTVRKDAERLLRRRLGEIATSTFAGPRVERVLIDELAEDFLREYRINGRKSLKDAEARWIHHLKPFFGDMRAANVTSDLVARYIDKRQQDGARNGTINRELSALKRMFKLALTASPPKAQRVPHFAKLIERNVRTGFVEDAQYTALAEQCGRRGLWLRGMFELGYTYGWRQGELLGMRIGQIDLANRSIRLEPGTTKNDEGREVVMTPKVYELVAALATGKQAVDHLFTRDNGKPVGDMRMAWWTACVAAGVGHFVCPNCEKALAVSTCKRCKLDCRYKGLIFHDLRRTAARNLRRAGVAEGVIMRIGGWKTRSVFERYAIVSQSDITDAMLKLEKSQHSAFGHSLGTSGRKREDDEDSARPTYRA